MIIDKNFSPLMERVFAGSPFSREEAEALVTSMIDGRLSDTRIAAVLTGMRFAPPDTLCDILSGALESIVKHRKASFPKSLGTVDLGGVGSRGTAGSPLVVLAGLVAAAAGARISFFGSKSFSGQYTNTEFVESLGVKVALTPDEAEADLGSARLTYLRASAFYPAFQHLTSVRRSLGFHTAFDVLVPLSNPLALEGQVLTVFDPSLVPVVARLLVNRKRALVVCPADGSNQLSALGDNHVAVVENGQVREERWTALGSSAFAGELCEVAYDVAEMAADLLTGTGPESILSETVCVSAAAALWCAGKVNTIAEGLALARTTLRSGAALKQLQTWQVT